MAENGKPEEIDLNALRLLLAELATGQARHDHMMQQHAEEMARVWERHDTEIADIRGILRNHAEIMARVGERLDRMSRHLEVHSDIIDSLIRGKADRKKRG